MKIVVIGGTGLIGSKVAAPLGNTIEIAGPEPLRFEDFARERLRDMADHRVVVTDPQARSFGAPLSERTLGPGPDGATLSSRKVTAATEEGSQNGR